RMEKLTKVGLNLDEAFSKQSPITTPAQPSSAKSYPPRKPKPEATYVANAWVDEKHDNRPTERPRFERRNDRPPRHYDNYGMSLTEALRLLSERKLIKPLEKPADDKPIGTRMHQYCNYHQVKGHHIDFCRSLR
ncbi:hypothetical protein RF094_24215, partial [Serratia marcescens]|nr:hypothetical protein [Serratia marcescens]